MFSVILQIRVNRPAPTLSAIPMSTSETEIQTKTVQEALSVTFYMTLSIGLVFLNGLVLTDKAGALFLSWYQFVVTYAIITTFPTVL
jgi:hypothetical protein